jgi:electron-transferring-flavoprotein dehydrogenase
MYHMNPNLIHLGMVIGLDYKNPYLNPYEEFQLVKTHPEMKKFLEGGECISYGARALNEGGYHAIPKLTFPGGMLAGDSAGFLDVSKIKGSHNAMKTGMLAAESIHRHFNRSDGAIDGLELTDYDTSVHDSWVVTELKKSRNFKGGFEKGLWFGMGHGFLTSLTKGREPYSLTHKHTDATKTADKSKYKPIDYPKKDGVLTFELLTNL